MVADYHILPCGSVYVRIDFRGKYAFVSQHLLYHTKVGTVFNEMRRKGMTESVG